jgi:class II lanthipeptide synthase
MSRYRQLVAEALRSVRISSPTRFHWHGASGPVLPPDVESAMEPETARRYLVHTLQAHFYASFYCPGAARPRRPEAYLQPQLGFTPFLQSLSSANAGTGSREPGWLVVRRDDDGQVVVVRDGLTLWARPEEVAGSAEPGAAVSVLLPKELFRLSPGFYMALGDAALDSEATTIVRFYWNLRREGAAVLMAMLTAAFNQEALGFRLKVLNHPEGYSRCDAAVLYVSRRDYGRAADIVAATYPAIACHLKPAIPALTKPLAEGLGLAEDPGPAGDSFGMHRCRLLADAVVRAHERGTGSAQASPEDVEARFGEEGISLDRPYLNPGSADDYALLLPGRRA